MSNILKLESIQSCCTGCFSCEQKCPFAAIQVSLNNEGFYYPIIDSTKCTDCGLCLKACPLTSAQGVQNTPKRILSGYANDESIRMTSSSGGMFALLANEILSDGGIVYGAAFDRKRKEVCHTSTDVTPLKDIMRSKYVQSRIGDVYAEAEAELKSGRSVLFSGTPCQIKGLHSFLEKEYDNLITVDFMCHGVPSTGLFRDVIDYYERTEQSDIVDFTFREKDLGWFDQVTKIYLSNGKVLSEKSSYYYYYYAFLSNYTLRKSCLDCTCYNTHASDITLADNWSVKGDNKGISLILVNTENGCAAFDRISHQATVTDYSNDFRGYDFYRHDYSKLNRIAFFDYYLRNGFDKTLTRFFKKVMRKNRIKQFYQAARSKTKKLILGRST